MIATTRTTPHQPFCAFTCEPVDGSAETTDEKMISDMPLPMPRWVMASPIHIRSAVPAVSVVTMRLTRTRPKFGTRSICELLPTRPPPPLWKRNTRPVDCTIAMAIVR